MTEACANNKINIKNGWWEKDNLHIVDSKGHHIILINCEVLEYVSPEECPDGIGYFDFKATGRIQSVK